jgi:putative phosphoserine phosphatase/1-acylglycerol-3-phosphate O-acyltransferase
VKQLASGAALVAATTGGVAVGLLRRDRQAGVNFAAPRWLSTLFLINGVKLEVVGRDNLTAQRPAVFVFNHRNNFDALLAASLVERDFAAVVDKELAIDPISRALGSLADTTFVDWDDPTSKADALSRIEDAARQGRSILIAPEGARVDTMTVGPFDQDAFRIAVTAGIPIVPIVIRNAEQIAGRNSPAMVAGIVDVAVLKPIPVETWSLDTIDEHVSEVRHQFIETLADWPS